MGIRFWCPNGHKLNVKTFQAGRRGICPYCGARFVIPTESTRHAGAGDRMPEPLEHSVHEGGFATPPAAAPAGSHAAAAPGAAGPGLGGSYAPAQPGPTEYPAGPSTLFGGGPAAPAAPAADYAPAVDFAAAPQAAFQSLPLTPTAPAVAGGAPSGSMDPLAEAPDVVWYVRPPTGGQFGPATADVMRNWIAEGRVSPDSLVWREGWRDWQEAGTVFPALGAEEGGAAPVAGAPPSAGRHAARPRSKASGPLIIALLVVAVLILFGVFIWVAFGQRPAKPPPAKTAQAGLLERPSRETGA